MNKPFIEKKQKKVKVLYTEVYPEQKGKREENN